MAHPHVERTAQPERKAALGLVELHRRDADVHHDAVDGLEAQSSTDVGEIGKAILDQGQPTIRTINQIESTGNRRPVAIDADDAGSRHSQDRAAVAAGAKGGVDIDAAIARLQQLDRLAPEHGDMTRRGRGHAPTSGVMQCRELELDTKRPIAPRMLAPQPAVPVMEPPQARAPISHSWPQILSSDRNLLGCHGNSRESGPRPSLKCRFGSSPLSNGT